MFEPEPVGWGADLDPHRPPDRLPSFLVHLTNRWLDLTGDSAMRRIDESIESLTPVAGGDTAPLAFRWRGRRYVVGAVLAHWVETGAWWRRVASRPTSGSDELLDPERWLWRVEACRGAQTGVFDLCMEIDGRVDDRTGDRTGDRGPGRWSLHAIYD